MGYKWRSLLLMAVEWLFIHFSKTDADFNDECRRIKNNLYGIKMHGSHFFL